VVILDFIQSLQELGSFARNVHAQVALGAQRSLTSRS
jgi:hypothetical protein